MSQENLSPGNCVAATVFPKEIKSLPINVATVYPAARKYCRLHARDWHFILSAKGAKILNGDIEIYIYAGIALNARPNPCMTAAQF